MIMLDPLKLVNESTPSLKTLTYNLVYRHQKEKKSKSHSFLRFIIYFDWLHLTLMSIRSTRQSTPLISCHIQWILRQKSPQRILWHKIFKMRVSIELTVFRVVYPSPGTVTCTSVQFTKFFLKLFHYLNL